MLLLITDSRTLFHKLLDTQGYCLGNSELKMHMSNLGLVLVYLNLTCVNSWPRAWLRVNIKVSAELQGSKYLCVTSKFVELWSMGELCSIFTIEIRSKVKFSMSNSVTKLIIQICQEWWLQFWDFKMANPNDLIAPPNHDSHHKVIKAVPLRVELVCGIVIDGCTLVNLHNWDLLKGQFFDVQLNHKVDHQ